MDLQLDGKRALVLASSKGIGRASAEGLVDEGCRVAISSRSEANLREAKKHILESTGAPDDYVHTLTIDMSEPETVTEGVETATDRLGGLDVLVTNTGTIPKIGFDETSLEQFDDAYVLLLRSIITATRAAIPALTDGDGGAITNLIAASALEPEANHILANTLRPGVFGFAKSLAREYADEGIRVNNVCPKKVGPLTPDEEDRTNHIDRYAEEHGLSYAEAREEFISELLPIGRAGDLEDFGRAVAFVSSPVASHITGHNLHVDGGYSEQI